MKSSSRNLYTWDVPQNWNDPCANEKRCVIFYFIIWLAPRAGKMNQTAHCDWLPERARWSLGTTRCIPQAKFRQKPYNKSFIDQVCSVKMAGYWPRSFFASVWTSTSSRSMNTQKKNLANIQPSWPHTWSITHTWLSPSLLNCYMLWFFDHQSVSSKTWLRKVHHVTGREQSNLELNFYSLLQPDWCN